MSELPGQQELALEMAPQMLDSFTLVARLCLSTPEVEYKLTWEASNGIINAHRIFLDAAFPIERMSRRILDHIISAHGTQPWSRKTVNACLNALVGAYGSEEPF